MRFAICNELFEGWTFQRTCEFVAQAGYQGLEIAPYTLGSLPTHVPASARAALRREAAAAGVTLIGLHWLLARTEGMHLTSADATVRARLSRYLIDLAVLCSDLGGHLMVFGSPKQRSRLPGISPSQAFDRAVEVFRAVAPAAGDCGVTVCMEPLAPVETDFITTCAEGAQLVTAVDHPNFVLHLDVKAMSTEPSPVPDLIRQHAPRAGHFHANDANLRGPGFGDTDFVPIFKALQEAGYDRWVSVEVFDNQPDPETIATRSLAYMRGCLPPAADTAPC